MIPETRATSKDTDGIVSGIKSRQKAVIFGVEFTGPRILDVTLSTGIRFGWRSVPGV